MFYYKFSPSSKKQTWTKVALNLLMYLISTSFEVLYQSNIFIGFFSLVLREVNANICLTQGCVVGIVFSDIQPKPFQKILGNFFCKALQSALRMIQMLFGRYTMLFG